jgi:hypothetical protein
VGRPTRAVVAGTVKGNSGKPVAVQAVFSISPSGTSRSISIEQPLTRATMAPIAAAAGAISVPTTPTVSGKWAITSPSCLMVMLRTFPSWITSRSRSIKCLPSIVTVSVFGAVFVSCMALPFAHPAYPSCHPL